jgi:hypothetical protein
MVAYRILNSDSWILSDGFSLPTFRILVTCEDSRCG